LQKPSKKIVIKRIRIKFYRWNIDWGWD
jgi:hypothetical protein